MTYSPKVREDIIPSLYHYSKSVSRPMTKTVNRILTRGLLLEPLPAKAIETLPDDAMETMRKKGLEDIALEKGNITPVTDLRSKSESAEPYLGLDEVVDWYDSAMYGLARALATKDAFCDSHSHRPPSSMGNWFYENAALNLGQTLYQALTMSTGIHLPIADYVADRIAANAAQGGYRK